MATFYQVLFEGFVLDVDNDLQDEQFRVIYRYVDSPTDPSGLIYAEYREVGSITWLPMSGGPTWQPPYVFDSEFQFCDGANLQKFRLKSSYPYAYKYQIENSPICSTVVCDIQILTPVSIVPESASGAGDASITVQATSSHGAISYSLNNSDYQTSNVFENLSEGGYTVYAKDENGCVTSVEIEIPGPSVYGLEYTFNFKNKLGENCLLEFYRKDYSDIVSELPLAVEDGLQHRFNKSGDDKYTVIKSSQLVCNFIAQVEGEFASFYTLDDYEIKAQLYVNGTLVFVGYVVQNLYQESFKSTPFPIQIVLTDGLPLLKNIQFTNVDGSAIKGDMSLSNIVQLCLNKLNLGLNIYESINIYEENHTQVYNATGEYEVNLGWNFYNSKIYVLITFDGDYSSFFSVGGFIDFESDYYGYVEAVQILSMSINGSGNTTLIVNKTTKAVTTEVGTVLTQGSLASPLRQTYIDAENYSGMSCYAVLENILGSFGSRLFQEEGTWHIEQVNEKAVTHKRRLYDYLYNYISEEDFNPVFVFEKTTNHKGSGWSAFLQQSGNLSLKNPFGTVTITQKFNTSDNMVKGGILSAEDFGIDNYPLYWGGNAIVYKRAGNDEENFAFSIEGNASNIDNSTYVAQDLQPAYRVEFAKRDWINLKFAFNPVIEGTKQDDFSSKVYFSLKMTSGAFTIYLKEDGDVTTEEHKIEINTERVNEWNDYSILFRWYYANDYSFTLTFYQGVGFFYTIRETMFTAIECIYQPEGDKAPKEAEITATNIKNFKYKEEIELKNGDVDNTINNYKYLFKGAYKLQDGTPTQYWARSGANESRRLLEILADNILLNHYVPWRILSGTVMSNSLKAVHTVNFPDISDAYFIVNGWTKNIYKNIFQIEFVELARPGTTGVLDRVKLLSNGNFKYLSNGKLKLLNEEE